MKMSVTKKFVGTFILSIAFITIAIAIFGTLIIEKLITNDTEVLLNTAAYIFKTEYDTVTDDIVREFKQDNGIDVTIFRGSTRTLSSIKDAVGTDMDSHIWADIQYGDNYFATDANVNGQPYFGYYIPVMENGECVGASFTGIPQLEANEKIDTSIRQLVSIVVMSGIIVCLLTLLIVRRIAGSIKKIGNVIKPLTNNDLTIEHVKYEKTSDELQDSYNNLADFSHQLARILKSIRVMAENLVGMASELNTATEATAETSAQMSKAIDEISDGAESLAKNAEDTMSNISDMSVELDNIKGCMGELEGIAESMNKAKDNVVSTLSELQKVNSSMSIDIQSTSDQVNVTNESVKKIEQTIKMVQEIASQTNLLSLNASIEAARAGEHGKGFAVVASEIGKLASQSGESSTNIGNMVGELIGNYQTIIENMKNTMFNMSIQNEKLHNTQDEFILLEGNIDTVLVRINDIVGMVNSIDESIKVMVDVISGLSAISQENLAAVEESTASIQGLDDIVVKVNGQAMELNNDARELMEQIDIFKVKK